MPDTEYESGLYVIKTGTVEQAFAAHGYARPSSIEAALRQISGATGSAVGEALAGLDIDVEALPVGAEPTASFDGEALRLTLGLPAGPGDSLASLVSASGYRALAPLREAMDEGAARVVVIGDSQVEGANIPTRAERWPERLVAGLRRVMPAGGDAGVGWVQAVSLGGPAGFSWSGGSDAEAHMGGKGRTISAAAADTGTFTTEFTTADVYAVGDGVLSVSVDGGTAQTINLTGAGPLVRRLTVTAPPGTHTLTVGSALGSVTVLGACFRTADTGITLYNAGKSGSRMDSWAHGEPAWGHPDAELPFQSVLADVQPHLVVVALGANNLLDVWGREYPASEYAADAADLLRADILGAAPDAGVLFVTPPQHPAAIGTTHEPDMLAFEQELVRAVGHDPQVSVVHTSQMWAPRASSNDGAAHDTYDPWGYLSDSIHWSVRGQRAVADWLLGWAADAMPALAGSGEGGGGAAVGSDAFADVI